MPVTWKDEEVICPYFVKQKEIYVVCEGFDDIPRVRLYFKSEDQKNEMMKNNCNCGKWRFCRIAQAAGEKHR